MSATNSPILARVNPIAVAVDSSLLQPTAWDRKVVNDDLRRYVSRSRVISATPVLHLRGGRLFVVNGLPFLTAAKEAAPPLSEVVCDIRGEPSEVRRTNLQVVDVSSLLNSASPDEVYRATDMIFFRRPLNDQERQAVKLAIAGFFQEVTSPEWKYGGQYRRMEGPEWSEDNDIMVLTWERSASEGHDMLRLQQLLRNIDSNIAPIRSYNGISLIMT